MAAPLRSSTAFISASVTAPRSSGRGTVTPVALRIASALRRMTSSTAPSMALSGEKSRTERTKFRRLAEAVDPAFALLVARRVPRQIVVDDGVEETAEG